MDLLRVHVKNNNFPLMNSLIEKPICCNYSMAFEIRASKKESFSNSCRYRSLIVKPMAKKNSGGSYSNSSSSSSGDSDQSNAGDGLKGNNPLGGNKSGDTSSPKSTDRPLDWREFRSLLYIHEQAENAESIHDQSESLPLKWAHPISAPENGSLLVATGKLDGVRTFERTVVLLLRSGTRNPQQGPFGIVLNRSLNKKMKHMNPTNTELATTFADCSLYFGGPLDASMFLIRDTENHGLGAFQEVIPGLHFGSRNSLNDAAALVRNGTIRSQELRFFMGYAGWQMDQLMEEIESEYWYVAACSKNLIFGSPQNSTSNGLWEEILQLMGGHYSELSHKPKQDS